MLINLNYIKNYIITLCNHLRLSITSINFYQEVYNQYTGYGFKYLFSVCWFSSLIYSVIIINNFNKIEQYLTSENNTEIEYILSQIPLIQYDGKSISSNVEMPYFIEDTQRRRVAAIDLQSELNYSESSKIPVIFKQNSMTIAIVSVVDSSTQQRNDFTINYDTMFGNEPWALSSSDTIRQYVIHVLQYSSKVFIYMLMPILAIFRFMVIVFEKMFAVIVIYSLSYLMNITIDIKTACRLVMFASGVPVLLQPIFTTFIPQLSIVMPLLQIVPGILLVTGLVKLRK